MKTHSIFQGRSVINKVIAESLQYNITDFKYGWFTKDIYHQAFFYMLKRFGNPYGWDEDKESGVWRINYKGVDIMFRFASWIEVWVMGTDADYLSFNIDSYYKARHRKLKGYVELLLWENEKENISKEELELHNAEVDKFLIENPDLSIEKIDEYFFEKWSKWVNDYNKKHQDLFLEGNLKSREYYQDLEAKYGKLNSQNRFYLKVLRIVLTDFMNNPVWVRDVPHNFKGFVEGEIKESNLKIEVIQ